MGVSAIDRSLLVSQTHSWGFPRSPEEGAVKISPQSLVRSFTSVLNSIIREARSALYLAATCVEKR